MKNDENTPALKMQSRSGILKIQFFQPPYLGILNLNVNFGAISTMDGKVALFTQTEKLRDVNNKIADTWTEIGRVSLFKLSR